MDQRCFDPINRLPSRLSTPLLSVACDKDGLNVLESQQLLKETDLRTTNIKPGYTSLMAAVSSGDKQKTGLLLDRGAKVNYEALSDDNLSPLIIAVKQKNVDMVQLLLGKEADINFIGKKGGWTPLLYAIMLNDEGIVELILENGADPPLESTTNLTLDILLTEGHVRVQQMMQAHGINFTYPLMIAVVRRNANIVTTLLNYGAKLQHDTISPLALSIGICASHIVEILLLRGADHDLGEGYTALMAAIHMGDVKMVDMLLSHNAYTNHTPSGEPILHYAIKGENVQIVEALIKKGVSVNSTNSEGYTPLGFAQSCGDTSMVGLLLSYGAHP